MHDHLVFGGTLRSQIRFAELPQGCAGVADWTLTRADCPPAAGDHQPLGEDQVDGDICVRAFRLQGGFRLAYDDTGTFDILEGGARIEWSGGADAPLEAVKLDVLGRVLPLALHAAGKLSLHGSAVTIGDAGLAFLAPKFFGKSTLAQALVTSGAKLASDDVVLIHPEDPPTMFPGVPSVRLWSDSLARLALNGLPEEATTMRKSAAEPPTEEQVVKEAVPLAAIYLLRPSLPGAAAPGTSRTRLPPVQATVALLAEAKLGPLLGGAEAVVLLDRAAALVRSVPVYTLEITRGWDHLPRVVEQLLAWHSAPDIGSSAVESTHG